MNQERDYYNSKQEEIEILQSEISHERTINEMIVQDYKVYSYFLKFNIKFCPINYKGKI